MNYNLKQFDTPLLMFDMRMLDGKLNISNVNLCDNCESMYPLDLEPTTTGLASWLKQRIIPSNRAYVQNFLAKLGLSEKDIKGIIDICKGLSLNDCYWVVDANFSGTFSEYNLYDNNFSNVLSWMAFTGYGSYTKTTFRSSPEFTTNGMLAKCWRRVDGKIKLFKSGTTGAANTGNEPYSEYYAYQVAKAMGLDAIEYGLSKWKGYLCSTCELFTSKEIAYLPIGRLVKKTENKGVVRYLKNLGDEYYQAYADMVVFDAIICNTDRHLGNYGLLIDVKTNKQIKFAPIFDNGLSLLCYAMDDDLANLDKYIKTLRPALANDFIQSACEVMGEAQKDKLRKLLSFRFKKNPRYNLPNKRLKILEGLVRSRTQELLML
ncbi:MAG: XRE family transcriptional regulator [Leptospiraceae bacterium]|nr:hypothetical protein [Leptospiraceae bacterium]MCP5494392.1 XRE family transcriptional regulator [Leptospiraceae bacterium]